jgi:hypothetical protein
MDLKIYFHRLAMMALLLGRTAKRIDIFTEEQRISLYNQFMDAYIVWKKALDIYENVDV